jgi:phosphoribosylglycinamide formyltransferase 1
VARPLPIGVLVSGEGTTLDGLAELVLGHHLDARIALVVADRPHAKAIERARGRGLPTIVLPSHGVAPEEWSAHLTHELLDQGVELVVLAGFLTILSPAWLARWDGRAVNVHPSLLPRYGGPGMYGRHVLEAVLASGDRETGVTVHLVTDEVDGGPPIAQEVVAIAPGETVETLRDRIHPIEVSLLAATIRRFADGSLPLPYRERDRAARGRRDRPDARE